MPRLPDGQRFDWDVSEESTFGPMGTMRRLVRIGKLGRLMTPGWMGPITSDRQTRPPTEDELRSLRPSVWRVVTAVAIGVIGVPWLVLWLAQR